MTRPHFSSILHQAFYVSCSKIIKNAFCLSLLVSTSAFAQDFSIYVSDAGQFEEPPWQILKFDSNGENPEVFISDNLAWPQDIFFLPDDGGVLISNLNSGRITRHDAATGAYLDDFATNIGGPTRMKLGPDNLLYVLQWTGNGRVRRFQLDGTAEGDFTDMAVPQSIGLDWDSSGNLYVSSFSGKSVRKFDSSGSNQGLFISSNLAGPTNIWFDQDGDLLVSDYSGTAVKRFDSAGVYQGDFITGLSNSEGVDFLANGNILIGNGATRSVRMYDSQGQFIEDLVPTGSGNLMTPNAVVIHPAAADQFSINAGLNDAWFNPATAGQGFFITVFPEIKQLFLAWFTFDTERPGTAVDAVLGDAGHRWLTAFGGYTGAEATLDIEVTTGGVFDSMNPSPTQQLDGTISVVFSDCENGHISYSIPSINRQGNVPIQRIALDNVAFCETAVLATQVR